MLVAIWDFFFTRRIWTEVSCEPFYSQTWDGSSGKTGYFYILKDQFGNIKRVKI